MCTGPPHARGRAHARTHGPPRPLLLSAGAWIVTGGSHTGVMKQVGKAVRDSSLSSGHDDGDVVTIGIATWGVVHNREGLVHPEVSRVAAPGLPRGGLAPRGVPRVPRWQVTPGAGEEGGARAAGRVLRGIRPPAPPEPGDPGHAAARLGSCPPPQPQDT